MFSMQKLLVPLRDAVRRSCQLKAMKAASTIVEGNIQEFQVREQEKRNEETSHLTELVRDFLDPADFYRALQNIGIEFFCGVPDSLLKENHVITANEGNAIGLAAGYHLASGKAGLVYLQNSGIGNTVNPLLSLAAPEVYSIPMLLLIGWRGEPGKRDEPQHILQGQVTPGMLNSLGIPFSTLPDFLDGAKNTLENAKKYIDKHSSPYALLVKRQTFLPYKLPKQNPEFQMSREQAVQIIVDGLHDSDIVVSTTGMLSRELFEYRVVKEQGHERDFLTVGSMGHASSIALGIALRKQNRQSALYLSSTLAPAAPPSLSTAWTGPQSMFSKPSVTTPSQYPAPALAIGSREGHYLSRFLAPMGSPGFPHWTRPGSSGGVILLRLLSPFLPPTATSRCRDYLLPPTATHVSGTISYLPPRLTLPGLLPSAHRDTRVARTPSLHSSTLTIGWSSSSAVPRGYTPAAPARLHRQKTLKKTAASKQYSTRGPIFYCNHQTPERQHSAPSSDPRDRRLETSVTRRLDFD
uniref:Thiamine pyrophosphate enzyme N-terminal TPP-binding domain-containing protein n=1 Tax=Timema monikensis TaxID=170555 RepID=A0A7R9EEY0_9NEOP|nr:unnamed protein product [Timema monikensis]